MATLLRKILGLVLLVDSRFRGNDAGEGPTVRP